MEPNVRDLAQRPAVAGAREWLLRHDADVLAWQRTIAEVPAPTGEEGERAALIAERFAGLGLRDIRTDAAGNGGPSCTDSSIAAACCAAASRSA